MLSVKDLSFRYNSEVAFHFPDITLSAADHLLVVGKSGTGKSTFLHLLAGILRPIRGTINISGTQIEKLSRSKTDKYRGRHIGLVFQKPHLIEALSVEDNLKLAQYFNGYKNTGRIEIMLKETGLLTKRKNKPHTLSQGEQQRLAIARGMLNEPRLILADEPTASLDDENALNVAGILLEQAEKHRSNLIVATHDQRLKKLFPNSIQLL